MTFWVVSVMTCKRSIVAFEYRHVVEYVLLSNKHYRFLSFEWFDMTFTTYQFNIIQSWYFSMSHYDLIFLYFSSV